MNYQIVKLQRVGDSSVQYKLDERTGFYRRCNNEGTFIGETTYGLMDLLIVAHYKIVEVKCNNQILKIGNRLTERNNINFFSVKQNRLFANDNVDASTVVLYIPPPPVVMVEHPVLPDGRKVNNFRTLQTRIEGNAPIMLGNAENPFVHNPNETLTGFLKNFILTYNNTHHTYHVRAGRIQTEAGKRRSLGDLFLICKHYYPECNLHEVIDVLYTKLPVALPGLGSLICQQINKRVWWNHGTARFDGANTPDEYGFGREYYILTLNATSDYGPAPVVIEPVVEAVVETVTPPTNDPIFDQVKAKFPIGTKFKSVTTGTTFKVNSTNFYNGVRSVILVQRDGSRKLLYDKNTRVTAQIVR